MFSGPRDSASLVALPHRQPRDPQQHSQDRDCPVAKPLRLQRLLPLDIPFCLRARTPRFPGLRSHAISASFSALPDSRYPDPGSDPASCHRLAIATSCTSFREASLSSCSHSRAAARRRPKFRGRPRNCRLQDGFRASSERDPPSRNLRSLSSDAPGLRQLFERRRARTGRVNSPPVNYLPPGANQLEKEFARAASRSAIIGEAPQIRIGGPP